MIRFIDLRDDIFDDGEPYFAFFDTVVDKFVGWDQCYTWGDQSTFKTDFVRFNGWREMEIERFLRLIPEWVPEIALHD